MYDQRDSRETPYRIALRSVYESRGIVPKRGAFGCASHASCLRSAALPLHTGNWAFVGVDYGEARINGYSARVLFVAMDRGGYGGADEEQLPDAQASFRRSIELPENAHMGGTALILKHLVDDFEPRKLSGQCALTNAVKCVQHTGTMTTGATKAMISNCAAHLGAEIALLDPDIVVTQGGHPAETILALLKPLRRISQHAGQVRGIAEVLTNSRVVLLTTPHPARQPGLKWRKGILPPFLLEAISTAKTETTVQLRTRATGQPRSDQHSQD